tara:strand:+ start:187 stop:360 length:174 start_codon:yes stop_codon:yes gene_type:complete
MPMATTEFSKQWFANQGSVKKNPASVPLKRPVWPPMPSALSRRQWQSELDQPIELSS